MSKIGNAARLTITTSWDDGHPLDFRIAGLLSKYGLRGTFYVPFENYLPTLSSTQIHDLSQSFEIGAHTVHHTDLTGVCNETARNEIFVSKSRIEDVTGQPCLVFCFPRGHFRRGHVAMAREAGFVAARTVELMSLDVPHVFGGIALIPTTIQAHSHSPAAYYRNAAKRIRLRALWNALAFGHGMNWAETALAIIENGQEYGGVFHLWGHSWEIDENCQWDNLERVLACLGQCRGFAKLATNSQLCDDGPREGSNSRTLRRRN